MEKETKAALHSKDREYAKEIVQKLKNEGIEATLDNFLGNYIIYVATEDYEKTLEFGRMNASDNKMGSLNDYNEFRGLYATSLVYVKLRDCKDIDKAWQYGGKKPYYINNFLRELERILPFKPYITVNGSDGAFEVLINDQYQLYPDKYIEKIIDLVNRKYTKFLKECIPCKATGKVLKEAKERNISSYQKLFESSMFIEGMFYPIGSNIAPKSDCENNLDETGYWMSTHSFGGQNYTISSPAEGRFKCSVELYEKMSFNSKWDAVEERSISIHPIGTTLVDNISFSSVVEEINENECQITTDYVLKRKTEVFPKLPFNKKYPTTKSVRNGMFAYPLDNGEYLGTYKERFVKIANGTRLLHFSDQSPFFEVFEIPEDFNFANAELERYPKVFDDTSFDKDDKDMKEIMNYLGLNARNLVLSNK